ncbi:MAG: EamA family transporter [Enterocloster clostridioformis]
MIWIGILFGLGAAVFYASVVLFNKSIRHVSGINRTFYQFLAAILVLTPYVCLTGGSHLSEMDVLGVANLLVVECSTPAYVIACIFHPFVI